MTKPPKYSPEELKQKRDDLVRKRDSLKYEFEFMEQALNKSEPSGPEERQQAAADSKKLMPRYRQTQREWASVEGQIRNIDAQIRAAETRRDDRAITLEEREREQDRER